VSHIIKYPRLSPYGDKGQMLFLPTVLKQWMELKALMKSMEISHRISSFL